MLRVVGQGLLLGVAGAALVLLLQELVDPTPLFWSVPWEALQLVVSGRHRVNHLWLHRTQDLARKSIGRSIKSDGFAMVDGFVVTGVGRSEEHTSELQSHLNIVCRLLLEKKKNTM